MTGVVAVLGDEMGGEAAHFIPPLFRGSVIPKECATEESVRNSGIVTGWNNR